MENNKSKNVLAEESFIHESSSIKDSKCGTVKVFRNVNIARCTIGDNCSVGDDSTIERSIIGNNVAINRRSYINDSEIGRFTYTGINTIINWSKIGAFCSIGRNVDIGGVDHDYTKISTMPASRFKQIFNGGGKLQHESDIDYCEIGNDVWIAAGVQILHKVKIGDGAVIGAGAVVTKDVPPYAIVVGVPAKIIGYRCPQEIIDELVKLKWWSWPSEVLMKYMGDFIEKEMSSDTITWMKSIYENEVKISLNKL